MQLRRKKKPRHTSWRRIFQKFEDEIPTRATLTTSHTETGAYTAIPAQKNRDGPIEEITVHFVLINRIIENKAVRNRQQ